MLSEALFKDCTLNYDRDDSSVIYIETPDMICHFCAIDCKFAPHRIHSNLECLDCGKVSRGEFCTSKSEELRTQRAFKIWKERPSLSGNLDNSAESQPLVEVDPLLKWRNLISLFRKRVLNWR